MEILTRNSRISATRVGIPPPRTGIAIAATGIAVDLC